MPLGGRVRCAPTWACGFGGRGSCRSRRFRCALSWDLGCERGGFRATEGALRVWVGRKPGQVLQQNSSNIRGMSLFQLYLFEKFLLLNPAAPYKEGPALLLSPPFQLDPGLSRSGPSRTQLSALPSRHPQSPWCTQPPCVYHFVLIPLPVTSSNQVSPGAAQTLFGRGGSP